MTYFRYNESREPRARWSGFRLTAYGGHQTAVGEPQRNRELAGVNRVDVIGVVPGGQATLAPPRLFHKPDDILALPTEYELHDYLIGSK